MKENLRSLRLKPNLCVFGFQFWVGKRETLFVLSDDDDAVFDVSLSLEIEIEIQKIRQGFEIQYKTVIQAQAQAQARD